MSDKTVQFPVLDMTGDVEVDEWRQAINWQSEQIAIMGARVSEIYDVFAQLKPLMGALPKMPGGMVMPPMPPFGR